MRPSIQLCSLLLLLPACLGDDGDVPGRPPDPPDLGHEYETEHLRVHSDVERCAGDFARWEGFVAFAQEYVGVEAPGIVDLYVWDDGALDDMYWCGRDEVGGCFAGDHGVYSEVSSVEHELVHAITVDFANHDRFFVEGLAEAVAEDTVFGVYPPVFHLEQSSEVDYPSAGHFVRWLLESAGPEPFLEYMAIPDAGRVGLEAIYGENVESRFYAEAPDAYPRIYEYPAPALTYDGNIEWTSELTFDCSRDDVRGRAEGRVVVREWIVEEPGFYAVWASTDGMVEFRRQFTTVPWVAFFQAGGIGGRPFEAGTYEISVVASPGTPSGALHIWLDQASVPTWPTEDS